MKYLFVSLALFFISAVHAAPSIDALLDRPTRPTMPEIASVISEIEARIKAPVETEPYLQFYDRRLDVRKWLQKLLNHGPNLIAAFEKTYPGATWVFLGRDGLPWADLFEAFYLSIGQENRVLRIGISKPSLTGVNDSILTQLLKSHGIDRSSLRHDHPFVFVDSVSNGYGRQGRRLLGAIFADWMKTGDPLEIINKTGMIGMIVSTFQGAPNNLELKPLHLYQQALFFMDHRGSHPSGEDLADNVRILTYPEAPEYQNEAGYTHFLGAWHESFGQIGEDSSGRYSARPGELQSVEMRRTILWIQKEIWNHAHSAFFKSKVLKAAQALNYQFPLQRPLKPNLNFRALEKFKQRILHRSEGMRGEWLESLHSPGAKAEEWIFLRDRMIHSPPDSFRDAFAEGPARNGSLLSDLRLLELALDSNCEDSLRGRK